MNSLSKEFVDSSYPDYFYWLCEMVCVDGRYTDESYWILAKALWDTEYYWSIDRDENRAKNVSILRYRYCNIGGFDGYDGKPSVLEVLVMLSENMYDILDDLDGEDQRPIYFWEMIDNLGLSLYSDYEFNAAGEDRVMLYFRRIDQKLSRWMDRKFRYSGHGSPFPLRDAREDQRDVELWYQMNAYLIENY